MGLFSGLALVAIAGVCLVASGVFYISCARSREKVRELEAVEQASRTRIAALEAAESRLRCLDQYSVQGVIVHRDFQPLFANPAAARIFGFQHTQDLLALESILPLIASYDRARLRSFCETRLAGGEVPERFEIAALRQDGVEILIELAAGAVDRDGSAALQLAIIDATDRERAERGLHATEERFQALLAAVPEAVAVIDAKGDIVLGNERIERLFGYTHEELSGRAIATLIPTLDLDPGAMAGGDDAVGKRKDGFEFPIEFKLATLATGENRQIAVFIRDTSAQRQGERALRESEGLSRSLIREVLDNSQIGISILDANFVVVWVNGVLERYFGISREEIVGKRRAQFVERTKNIFEEPQGFAQRVLATYDDNTYREQFECHVLADKGLEERWLEHRSQPVTTGLYAGGRIEQYYDVSERVQAQKALVQAQKMEAVAKLTSGMAHDFNNLLTVIIGNLQLLEAQIQDQPRLAGMVKTALRRARQGTELTEKLRMFSRTRPLDVRQIDLNQHMYHLTELLRQILDTKIKVDLVRGEKLWRVKADPGQLETAVVNLAMNARDAMPEGGNLVFETRNISLDDNRTARQFGVKPGRYVLLLASDTGVGMAPETLKCAFEPFFSTKRSATRESGDGSGLGLSMVYGFVKQSGGHVILSSEPGKGTTVKLCLPKVGDDE